MTQTEQWIACLAMVYAVPSFLSGIGLTLFFVHLRDRRRAKGEGGLELGNLLAIDFAPADKGADFLPDGLKLQ